MVKEGDLYIQIKVKEDSHFVRHDDDIYFEALFSLLK